MCRISEEQKELLLNDVINKVSSESTSLVEVAFELLVLRPRNEGAEVDISEFVDQCNAISEMLVKEDELEESQTEDMEDGFS